MILYMILYIYISLVSAAAREFLAVYLAVGVLLFGPILETA